MDPFKAMIASGKVLLARTVVPASCIAFMLIVPCWRHFVEVGEFFPYPFSFTLALNLLFSSVVMMFFLLNFSLVTERLMFIANCLEDFEQKTINPSEKSK